MATVLIPLAEGVEELEAVTIIDLLRRAGIDVTTAGLNAGPVTGSRKTVLIPDITLEAAIKQEYDMVVLPGGLPGATNLQQDARLIAFLQTMAGKGKYTAAICAAPKVLATAGLLEHKHATCYPGSINNNDHPTIKLDETEVVVDGKVVTSRGPGTAMDLALELIRLLVGSPVSSQVEDGLKRPTTDIKYAASA